MIVKESEAWRFLADLLSKNPNKLVTCLCFSVDRYLVKPNHIDNVMRSYMWKRASEHVSLKNMNEIPIGTSAYAYPLWEGEQAEARILAAYWMALEAEEEEQKYLDSLTPDM